MGQIYKNKVYGIEYDAETLDKDEMETLVESFEAIRTAYNSDGKAFKFLDDTDLAFYQAFVEIMKRYFNGAKFVGLNPDEGEFGVRLPQVEDLTGFGDTEWGAGDDGTATHAQGTAAWTAGQRAWIWTGNAVGGTGALSVTQNNGTYANATEMRCWNTGGSQKWAMLMFGVRSFSTQPVVKDLLITVSGKQIAVQQVEHQLRASALHIAKFDGAFFFHPERSFKIGATVRTAAQDKMAPLAVIALQGIRGKDLTIDRPTAA